MGTVSELPAWSDALAAAAASGPSIEEAARNLTAAHAMMPTLADLMHGPVATGPPDWAPCDAAKPPRYIDVDENGRRYVHCRCLICARCGHHTGNATQGHLWRLCEVTRTVREFHQCCPGDCELEATP